MEGLGIGTFFFLVFSILAAFLAFFATLASSLATSAAFSTARGLPVTVFSLSSECVSNSCLEEMVTFHCSSSSNFSLPSSPELELEPLVDPFLEEPFEPGFLAVELAAFLV